MITSHQSEEMDVRKEGLRQTRHGPLHDLLKLRRDVLFRARPSSRDKLPDKLPSVGLVTVVCMLIEPREVKQLSFMLPWLI